MISRKKSIWEEKFSDNFQPNFIEKIIKQVEVSRSQVISELLPKNGGTLLDIACGTGDTLFRICSRFDKLIGIDIAGNRVKAAKTKAVKSNLHNINFTNSDLDKGLPLKSKCADFVICEASLSYFYDLNFVLSEVSRVLRPAGRFIVEVPNFAFITRRLALMFGHMPKTSSFAGWQDGGALHYFTYQSLKEMLEGNGFKIEKRTNSGVLPVLRKFFPELLAGDIVYVCKKIK